MTSPSKTTTPRGIPQANFRLEPDILNALDQIAADRKLLGRAEVIRFLARRELMGVRAAKQLAARPGTQGYRTDLGKNGEKNREPS